MGKISKVLDFSHKESIAIYNGPSPLMCRHDKCKKLQFCILQKVQPVLCFCDFSLLYSNILLSFLNNLWDCADFLTFFVQVSFGTADDIQKKDLHQFCLSYLEMLIITSTLTFFSFDTYNQKHSQKTVPKLMQ